MSEEFSTREHEEADENTPQGALLQIMAARRHSLTPLEARVWQQIMSSVPAEKFLAFLTQHFLTSSFAPTPADAMKMLDVAGTDPRVTFDRLTELVRRVGPYGIPEIADPVFVTAIEIMGGWVAVNNELPDRRNPDVSSYDVKAYFDRYTAAFNQAIARVRVEKVLPTQTLSAIGKPAVPLALGCSTSKDAVVPSRAISRSERYGA